MPAMLYEVCNGEVHGTKQQHIVRGMFSLSSSLEYIHLEHLLLRIPSFYVNLDGGTFTDHKVPTK